MILERALQLCKPGGRVVYSTGTYAPEGCEGVVASLLEESPIGRSFSILPLKVPRLKSSPGLTRWNKVQFPAEMLRAFRIWPHLNKTGGFFAVALHRTGNATKFEIEQEDSAHDIHVSSLILEELDRFWIPYECLNAYRVHRFSTKYDFMESVSVVPPPSRHVCL